MRGQVLVSKEGKPTREETMKQITMRAMSEIIAGLIAILAARGIIDSADVLELAAIAARHERHEDNSFNAGR
jgi:hypothetical protein